MAYRGEDAGDTLSAPTADGDISVSLGPNRISVSVGPLSLYLVDKLATITEKLGKKRHKTRRTSFSITGIVFARGIPLDDVGLWIEAREDKPSAKGDKPVEPRESLRRILGITPVNLMEVNGLKSLARLDSVAQRLRVAVDDYAQAAGIWSARGIEIGTGHELDRVLFADYGDRHAIYARKLFRDRARFLAAVHRDGRIVVPDGKVRHEVQVLSRYSVTVRGDYIRFADKHGVDLARISVPWVGPEDREELAKRIGQLVHRG